MTTLFFSILLVLVQSAPVGTFLVRPGANDASLNLSFKDEKVGVVHAPISKTMRGWQLTLGDVVTPPESSVLALVKTLAPTLTMPADVDVAPAAVAASSSSSSINNNNNNNNVDAAVTLSKTEQQPTVVAVPVLAPAVPVAAAPAAAPVVIAEQPKNESVAEPVFVYARQLEQLKNMGFADEQLLQSLLELYKGDVLSVVQQLVQ
jgi:hypothetical protein